MESIRVNLRLTPEDYKEVIAIRNQVAPLDGWDLPVTTLMRNAALTHLRGLRKGKTRVTKKR